VKKILLVSYFFPPVNSVAGLRAASWAKYFKDYGLSVTVVTRHWSGEEMNWSDLTADVNQEIAYSKEEKYDIYKLPSRKLKSISFFKDNLLKIPLFSKLFYVVINALGYFNAEADAFASFSKFLQKHLKENKYDLLIVSSPPLNLIRLASDLKRISNVPVHIDFRDLWNNGYLNPEYKPPFNLKWIDWFKRYYIKRWLLQANSVSAVSAPIADLLKYVYSGKIFVLTNGYDDDAFKGIQKVPSSKFRFSLIGTYYKEQSYDILVNGLLRFLKRVSPDEFVINLVGVTINDSIVSLFKSSLPNEYLNIIDRVGPEEAVQYTVSSEVLFQSAWKGYKGIYTTKLFDFMASGNNILIAPGDNDVIDELVNKSKTGMVVNNVDDFEEALIGWFKEWKKKGQPDYFGKKEVIAMSSRKLLTEKFAGWLKETYR
jgi:Glycosyltransferase Family 4